MTQTENKIDSLIESLGNVMDESNGLCVIITCLPGCQRNSKSFGLSPEAIRLYDELQDRIFVEMNERTCLDKAEESKPR